MDFVILKVNGQDVSNSSHEDAVRCFQSAQEPIIVEVLRRQPGLSGTNTRRNEEDDEKYVEDTMERRMAGNGQTTNHVEMTNDEVPSVIDRMSNKQTACWKRNSLTFPFVSTGVQTDWAGLVDEDQLLSSNPEERTSFDDFIAHDMDFEEVTLRKIGSTEKLGLTVCYSSGSEEADTEVYISEIIPESLAARDGRLREGDQILRVNGKDVANKEQTENLFAETNNAVTILVSRCLYHQDDDYDEKRLYTRGSPPISPDNIPAYQNSMIEQLIRQQQQQQPQQPLVDTREGNTSLGGPPIPSHTLQHVSCGGGGGSLPIPQNSSSENSRKSGKTAASPARQTEDRKQWLQDALKECTKRIESVGIRSQQQQQQQQQPDVHAINAVRLVEAYSSRVWSDTEHIYETIPESDNEPIYSSPYEHRQHLHGNRDCQTLVKQCDQMDTLTTKPWNSSSKSNSSGEEKDSSSAYNTGESCHSNPLTLELHQVEKTDNLRSSTLVLCTPPVPPTTSLNIGCSCSVPLAAPDTKQTSQHSKKASPQRDSSNLISATLPADTMYTNVANLQQTMILQQQLFKQALNRKNFITRESGTRKSKSHGNFQAPNLTQYQFIGSQQQVCSTTTTTTNSWNPPETEMEWKVKRRPDGTRYIARRPVRSRVLRNRAIKISEERAGHTTEDDTMSEMKVGRYWTKDERKRQLERARERKQRQQESLIQLQQSNNSESPMNEHNDEKSAKAPLNNVEITCKKTPRKKALAAPDDYTTVQEMLVHGNRIGGTPGTGGGKLMGLLSVTTV